MEKRYPDYLTHFRCLAGECPHTCCAHWAVPIDGETAEFYRALPGPLGEELRATLTLDEEGELCFPLSGERCPFLDGENLCVIHRELGEEHTGHICRTHPRFFNEFGRLEEVGLCASCPAACRLILEHEPRFLTENSPRPPKEETPELLTPLLRLRETAFRLMTFPDLSMADRLTALLLFANEAQLLLDEGEVELLEALCAVYDEGAPELPSFALPPRRKGLDKCLDLLAGLPILHEEWRELLEGGLSAPETPLPRYSPQYERMGVYFLYRHWLRGVWDGDVLSWAEFTVMALSLISHLSALTEEGEVFRLLCAELEHSGENMAALQDAFCRELGLGDFLSLVQA